MHNLPKDHGSGDPHVELKLESSGEEGADTRRAAPNYGQGIYGRGPDSFLGPPIVSDKTRKLRLETEYISFGEGSNVFNFCVFVMSPLFNFLITKKN